MRLFKFICLFCTIAVFFTMTSFAAEPGFSASSLTAKDVNCKKCHVDTPHIIHANKPVECVNCHGDKKSVEIPLCTKCHDGPIHKVHEGKVQKETCSYCHKNIEPVHTALTSDAVCSHCHSNLIEVHGKDNSCTRCHKAPPEIVKPIKSPEMILVCQNCHPQTSVATVHGEADNKTACYNCHKGTSQLKGSDVPHTIHARIVDCNGCHQQNNKVVLPQCTRCHDTEAIHAFTKIGKLTPQTGGLRCSACHTEESKSAAPVKTSAPQTTAPADMETTSIVSTRIPETTEAPKTPGFIAVLAAGAVISAFLIRRRV